ncbi:hypothetical protein [Acinetobacter sp.]|jgi:hypothetical protein|uniref:hypothetical protein n=1 Tax=Acinetobacter sp. TaxID=472 RepID=UPI00281B44AD|nr:hypothetical protein [Acinetobacter sp.]MDR0237422.1 hypothetical protein [Acinetobacter sp.]
MQNTVVLFDLENNMPTAHLLGKMVEHYTTLYFFNCTGHFHYSLEDLTELSGWINSGQVVILDVPQAAQKEYEYAVIAGQLLALLTPDTQIEIISATPSCDVLLDIIRNVHLDCRLVQIESTVQLSSQKQQLPSIETIQNKPYLQMVKKYCDALAKMTGKPNTVEKLRNSIVNTLQVVSDEAQHLVGMLINLRIVKCFDEQIAYRKKVLKQWVSLDIENSALQDQSNQQFNRQSHIKLHKIDQLLESLHTDPQHVIQAVDEQQSLEAVQQVLFKNFEQIDPVQIEVIHKLNDLKTAKPKDIYALRDLLEQMFPKSDIRLLLKELIEKGYIYWNGHEVIYSHEMYLN